ncbi:molybdopterin converting factor subunit 1 [Pyruvatibacter mobilis]|uniref:molybdopterin converting factor subunit 1 n=1 Tax=Pyruvatibacter mobilis TaxID=1712261 RepID=UPI003BACD272
MSAPVTILYFARLREAVGTPEEQLSLPDGIATVGALVAHLADADEDKRFAFDGMDLKFAVNQEQADADTPIRPGDEIALFPPVTGG